ncbi:hypothetical protein L484_026885 [Morus notabilis]|uniref:Uncharacterized protein n=1 Tax=Morus notabilis TaxID=981085 RepID=W9R5Z7_9ROSA|nr:hypothetical protein L484_026885 [Morus notabilis]
MGGETLDYVMMIRLLASPELMLEIPKDMSEEFGNDFLRHRLQRDLTRRWSAQKLLGLPYVNFSTTTTKY